MIGLSNVTNRTDPNSLKSRIFVGNLNTSQMKKLELESVFSKYGPLIGISVHKGYAFIQYANETQARTAVCNEDLNSYYGMKLDVTIASEPKNRKRGRPAAAPNSCFNNMNPLDLTPQAEALAAVGGQFSQLRFVNNSTFPFTPQYPNNVLNLSPRMAPPFGGNRINQLTPLLTNFKPVLPNYDLLTTSRSLASFPSAKRTRFENPPSRVNAQKSIGILSAIPTSHSGNTSSFKRSKQELFKKENAASDANREPVYSIGCSEDILICGHCRSFFESVDLFIAHKKSSCSYNANAGEDTIFTQCRCKKPGEPSILNCAYCEVQLDSAWELVFHCHTDHDTTIYSQPPNPPSSPSAVAKDASPTTSLHNPDIDNQSPSKSERTISSPETSFTDILDSEDKKADETEDNLLNVNEGLAIDGEKDANEFDVSEEDDNKEASTNKISSRTTNEASLEIIASNSFHNAIDLKSVDE